MKRKKILLTSLLLIGSLFLLTGCGKTKTLKLYDGSKLELERNENDKNLYETKQFFFFQEPTRELSYLEVVKVEYNNSIENGEDKVYYLNYPTYLNGCEFKDLRYDCAFTTNIVDINNLDKEKNAYIDFVFDESLIAKKDKINYESEKYTNKFYAHTSFISDNANNEKKSTNIFFKNIDNNVTFEGYSFKNLSMKSFVEKFGTPYYAFATYNKESDTSDFTYVYNDKVYTMCVKVNNDGNVYQINIENFK